MINKINDQLEKHNNILLYNEDLNKYYLNRDKTINAIYISTPRKGKNAFESILKQLKKSATTKNKTISNLVDEIQKQSEKQRIILYINQFEQLSKRDLTYYKELENNNNIQFIVNITEDKKFIDEDFINKFIILNNEYYTNRHQSINLSYTILLLVSFLIFILFIRLQLSKISYILNALWFTFLMYRTIYYIV